LPNMLIRPVWINSIMRE